MSRTCPKCAAPIADADLSPELGLARCAACEHVFPIKSAAAPPSPERPRREIHDLVLPPQMEMAVEGTRLLVLWKWYDWRAFLFAFFTAAWTGVIVMWWGAAIADGNYEFLLFSGFHVIVGFVLLYYTAATFVNVTTVLSTPNLLSIEHGPLPWFGSRKIPAASIQQLWVERVVQKTKHGTSFTWKLMARAEGRDLRLLGGFRTPGPPQVLEAAIEAHLNIENRPMHAEYLGNS